MTDNELKMRIMISLLLGEIEKLCDQTCKDPEKNAIVKQARALLESRIENELLPES